MKKENKKPKILMIRGENLTKWEMETYEPLKKYYDIKILKTPFNNYPTDEIDYEVFEAPTLLGYLKLGLNKTRIDKLPKVNAVINKILNHKFINIDKYLKEADLIHVVETYNWYTRQVIDERLKGNYKYKVFCTFCENIPFYEKKLNFFEVKNKEYVQDKIDYYVCVSGRAKEAMELEGINPDKIRIVRPGVDDTRFKPEKKDTNLLKKYNIPDDEIIIGSIGRLEWEKGFLDFIYSAKKLVEDKDLRSKKFRFLIIGNGSLDKKIRNLINKLGMRDKFIIENFVKYNDMPNYHNLIDIFILNSAPNEYWQEQFGMVFVESMACGKAVIAGRSGSIPETVGDAAILSQPADFMDLYEKTKYLILNPQKMEELGQKGIERVKKNFTNRYFCQQLNEAYKHTLDIES